MFIVYFILLDLGMNHVFWRLRPVGQLSSHCTLFFLAVWLIGDLIVSEAAIMKAC